MSIKDKIMEIINNPCGDCNKKCALNSYEAIECQLINIEGSLVEYFF